MILKSYEGQVFEQSVPSTKKVKLNQLLSNTPFKTEQFFRENTVRDSEFRKQQKHTEAEKFWSKNMYFSLTET